MSENDRVGKARRLVYDYVRSDAAVAINHPSFSIDDVTIVWFNKTLQNWKAIVITTLPDELMYEVTYNGVKQETYLDVYQKTDNIKFLDGVTSS